MFSQQHYIALATMLKEIRQDITKSEAKKEVSPAEAAAQREVIGQYQLQLQEFFKKDNPKFITLLFIGAASEHAPSTK